VVRELSAMADGETAAAPSCSSDVPAAILLLPSFATG
jgi:hypothetical protein